MEKSRLVRLNNMNITQLTKKTAFAPLFIACLNLLALLLWYLQAGMVASKPIPVAIRHFLPKDSGDAFYSTPAIFRRYSAKTQVRFQLNGSAADAAVLHAIHASAFRLKNQPDTNKIIKVTLADETSYQELIALINIVKRTDIKRYMLWKNDFYMYPPQPGDIQAAKAQALYDAKQIYPKPV